MRMRYQFQLSHPQNTCFKTCEYYFEESFNKKYQDLAISGESFFLLHVNARRNPCNLSNIESYIDNLVTTFSIIAVTEAWLKETIKIVMQSRIITWSTMLDRLNPEEVLHYL